MISKKINSKKRKYVQLKKSNLKEKNSTKIMKDSRGEPKIQIENENKNILKKQSEQNKTINVFNNLNIPNKNKKSDSS